jgi:hypothetical protein
MHLESLWDSPLNEAEDASHPSRWGFQSSPPLRFWKGILLL